MALEVECINRDPQRMMNVKEEEVVCSENMFANNCTVGEIKGNVFINQDSVEENRCLLPILMDDTDIGVVNEVVGTDDTGGNSEIPSANRVEEETVRREAIPLQTKMPMLSGRGRRSQIRYRIVEDAGYNNDQENIPNKVVLNSDPRTTMHYVKYIKRDGKTQKIWECGICGKEFRHQYTLMRHLPTHTDERNFKCETCGKGFRQMSTLSQHRAIHSDARPYVCEVCTKTFNRVSTLISHRKTHSDHKPHKCHVCGKGFHQKGNLRNHVFTHTNERPYKCEVCGKGFNQMSNLMCHKVKAHAQGDKNLYACSICKLEFPRKYALKSHEQYAHGLKRSDENVVIRKMDNLQFGDLPHQKENEKHLQFGHIPTAGRSENITDYISKSLVPHGLTEVGNELSSVVPEANSPVGIFVDPINTKAMHLAKQSGQTPFALLKLAKGNPVLVKVISTPLQKHMLIPASADDLKTAEEITVSSNLEASRNGSIKALQVKVPIVATVIQRMNADGNMTMQIESPGYNQDISNLFDETDMSAKHLIDANIQIENAITDNPYLNCNNISNSLSVDRTLENTLGLLDDSCPTTGLNLMSDSPGSGMNMLTNSHMNTGIQNLMSMEANGEIQFMCPSLDGISYQVLSPEEALQMMQQPGQTIEVVSEDASVLNNESSAGRLTSASTLPEFVDTICSDYDINTSANSLVMSQSDLDPFGIAVSQPNLDYSHHGEIMPC